ncbi:MAG TPA: hypothetical protein VNU71_05605 [Burkholderiaceae bacterium]|nr:hypothetical protein [Burkholderiaceae bacterium]
MTHPTFQHLGIAAALFCAAASACAGVIDYAQVDTSSAATTVVLVSAIGASTEARPAPIVSATYTRWDSGAAAGLGGVYRWALYSGPHQWVVGAGAGINNFRSRDSAAPQNDTAASARLQSEWSGPAPGGNYYALAQASSFRRSWLVAGQYNPSGWPVGADWARYHERGYQATTLGAHIALGGTGSRWFLRVGATHTDSETQPFIGLAYNGF